MQNENWMEEAPSEDNLFIKKVIDKFVVLWPWLILSASICIVFSYIRFKYRTPQYKIQASILVKDDKNSSDAAGGGMLQDFGLLSGVSNVDNEVEIFKSRTLMKFVVEQQQLFIKYYVPAKLSAPAEIFLNRPITCKCVDPFTEATKIYGVYEVVFQKADSTRFTLIANEKKYEGRFGDTISLSNGRIAIERENGFTGWPIEKSILINVSPVDNTVREYVGKLGVAITNKQTSIISLSLNEAVSRKGEIVLTALINAYLQLNVNDKNQIADSTIRFIDERLALVFTELSGIEKEIEGFKTHNKLTDISEQARLLLENTSEYARQLTTQQVQLSVVEALIKFLKDNENNLRVVPSSLVMQDPNFVALIGRYNEMQLQRDKLLMSVQPQHPAIINIDGQLKSIKEEALSSIYSIKKGIEVSVAELKRRTDGFEAQISKVPFRERIWLDYSRQQAIKQELYLFLLKKREETAISKSSTLANARIIDNPKADPAPFEPQKKNFILIGLVLGLVIPFSISFIKEFFNKRVNSINDITSVTKTPILGEIGHNNESNALAVTYATRGPVAEQFRALRTSVSFLLGGDRDKVILITSSMSGEGKSFLSINLSSTLALTGKKVILLELDLRKPRISEILKLQKSGMTNFLIDPDSNWKKYIQVMSNETSFDVISSGTLPPNPAELLTLPKLSHLINELKDHYDYIIMDSAPVGLVTDAQIIAPLADITLYLVRHSLTYKQQIKLIDKLFMKRSLPKMNIVVNDVEIKKGGYGYEGYGYGYGYGYGDDVKKGK